MAGNRRKIARKRSSFPDRTDRALSWRARRAGDHVLCRSERQCAGNQGVRQRRDGVRQMTRPQAIALGLGTAALILLLGALGFQYLDRLPPCELCMWQRWPHVGAAVAGLGGPLLIRIRLVERGVAPAIAGLAALLVAISGAVGVYHAGIEWHWWPGPQSCTGSAFPYTG